MKDFTRRDRQTLSHPALPSHPAPRGYRTQSVWTRSVMLYTTELHLPPCKLHIHLVRNATLDDLGGFDDRFAVLQGLMEDVQGVTLDFGFLLRCCRLVVLFHLYVFDVFKCLEKKG